jgi:predicted ATPase/class 3 adenylate cyclase/DNA-binding CsgD family transcriptional regulator
MGATGVSELLPTGTVTLLIANAAGSSRLWENQPREMAAAVQRLHRTLSDLVIAHGGVQPVKQHGRDSFVIVFGCVSDAVACALELQRAPLGPIRLRIGVHTDDVQLRHVGSDLGPTSNYTARLRDLAHGSQTVLSGTTSDLVRDRLPPGAWLTDLGTHPLRDLPQSERVVQLCHADLRNEFPPLRTPKAVFSQTLPAQLTMFVGRQTEMGELRRIITDHRLVCLTGAGGVGKTRLAVEVAAQLVGDFAGGVWYVDLAPIADPLVVPVTVARTLDLPDQPGRSTIDTLRRFVGDRKLMLLLDNCEHLVDACGALIVALLGPCPRLTILATSREPVGVAGELTWRVPSMSLADEAIDLFADRARRVRSDFQATDENAATIAEICQRLDGMPLAIELAAARVRALSLSHIVENLHDRFRLLTGGPRTALHRHQTLRASVDWSYALLTEPEQSLLRRLGVFLGGFDLEAAQSVGANTSVEQYHVLDQLSLLVDKSLVVAEDLSGSMRYWLLETIRQYALEKLEESGEADAVRDRHRDHYTERTANLTLLIGAQLRRMNWADVEIDNLRAAFAWSCENTDVEKALRLASSLQPVWLARARFREGLGMFDTVVADAPGPGVAPTVWVRAVAHQSVLAAWLAAPASKGRARAALSTARQLDNPTLIATTLNACAGLLIYDLAADALRIYYDEAAALAHSAGDQATLCETRLHQAITSNMCGEPMSARVAAEECHDLADALRDESTSRSSQIWLGNALFSLGNLDEASKVLAPLVEERAASGELVLTIFANIMLGRVYSYQGQPAPARACGQMALVAATDAGGFQEDFAYAMLAEVALVEGDVTAARQACEASWRHTVPERAVLIRCFNPMPEVLLACGELVPARQWVDDTVAMAPGCHKVVALMARAHIALAQGEPEQARRDAHDALVMAADRQAFLRLPDIVECLARLAAGDGNHQNAARLLGAAHAIRHQRGVVRFPMYQGGYDMSLESLRDALGESPFDAARAEGAALSIEETIGYARRGRGKRKRPSSGWESLTPTETDVVRLVRDGLANNEIAARLFISRRTVQTHLTHVYTKLGVSSRVQLVQEATRHA